MFGSKLLPITETDYDKCLLCGFFFFLASKFYLVDALGRRSSIDRVTDEFSNEGEETTESG